MAEGNTEIVRRAVDAWNAEGIDGLIGALHPDVEWQPDPDWPEAGVSHGRGEVRTFLEQFADAWEHVTIVVDELFESGGTIVIQFRWVLRGRSSGVEQELPVTGVLATRESLISSGRFFLDREQALRAAGIENSA